MTKARERLIAFGSGVAFLITMLVIAIAIPEPKPMQFLVFRVVLAIATAGVAAMIPGFLSVTVGPWVRSGGAIAVFVIVYFFSPAALVATPPPAESVALNHLEIGTLDGEVSLALEFEIVGLADGARAYVETDDDASFDNPTSHVIPSPSSGRFALSTRVPSGSPIFVRIAARLGKRSVTSEPRQEIVP